MSELIDNHQARRFEWEEDGKLAFTNYRLEANLLSLPHVEAHPDLRGQGTAGRMLNAVFSLARQRGWKVRPICGYAVAYLQRHPEFHDLAE